MGVVKRTPTRHQQQPLMSLSIGRPNNHIGRLTRENNVSACCPSSSEVADYRVTYQAASPIKTDQHSLGDELIMWDTVEVQSFTLSHDMPCRDCGHARHRFLPCDSDCDCRAHEVAELLEGAGAR